MTILAAVLGVVVGTVFGFFLGFLAFAPDKDDIVRPEDIA